MPVIPANEYDISYFDPQNSQYSHNGGYSLGYKKWPRISDDFLPHAESTGEFYGDLGRWAAQRWNLVGKKVLDLGCAKGFVVEGLRNAGVDAYGLDVSEYAVNAADPTVRPYLTIGDARTALANYKNLEFDVLFSRWFLDCMPDEDLPALITQMNRVARQQVHCVFPDVLPNYYNCKLPDVWKTYGFKKGTIIIPANRVNNYVTK